jgi:hypothetical protein
MLAIECEFYGIDIPGLESRSKFGKQVALLSWKVDFSNRVILRLTGDVDDETLNEIKPLLTEPGWDSWESALVRPPTSVYYPPSSLLPSALREILLVTKTSVGENGTSRLEFEQSERNYKY